MEVLARIAAHMANARQMRQARGALDAFGQATVAVRARDGRLLWQTPLARRLLKTYFDLDPALERAPEALMTWIGEARRTGMENREMPLAAPRDGRRLLASLHDPAGAGPEGEAQEREWLLVLREENHAAAVDALMAAFRLTAREAEVLYWVSKGKTSKDIGDILGSSPRTVNKHLEHVFEKLGVETRTAAASLALSRMTATGGERGT
jgi:DNA-binding CsgD family transcriptional regulator